MYMCKMLGVFILPFLAMVLLGCGKSDRDFKKACQKDTVESYQSFLDRYPDSEHSADARKRLDYLNQINVLSRILQKDDPAEKAKAIAGIRNLEKSEKLFSFVPALIVLLDDRRMVQIVEGVTFLEGIAVVTGKEGGSIRFASVAGEAAESLAFITGQSFGKDKEQWENWWKKQGEQKAR